MAVAFRNGSPHGNKLHVLQESINNTANTGKQDKIVIVRKKQRVVDPPKAISVTSIINNLQSNNAVLQKTKKEQKVKETTSARIQNPPPIAVARRNARERNRVKQVNNGFATLRQHIPDEIAEIYENANNSRAANKKLSKVETLRMAVEYIRSLENLLSPDGNTSNVSLSSFPSPASSESLQNGSSFEQGYFSLQSPMLEDEDSNPPTPLPPVSSHHYSRIPGTNTFQLLPGPPPLMYEDEENVHPLTPNSDLIAHEDMLISNGVITNEYMQGGPEFTVIHPSMLSPHVYSESSSSPQNIDMLDVKYAGMNQILYQSPAVFNQSIAMPSEIPLERLGIIMHQSEDALMGNGQSGKILYGVEGEMKREPDEMDGSFQKDVDTDDSMDDVIKWWETEGRHEDQS